MRLRHARVVLAFDLRCALRSARGTLFLVFYALVTGWLLSKLHAHRAAIDALAGAGDVKRVFVVRALGWVLGDDGGLPALLRAHPPTLVLYGQMALGALPFFVWASACDQTAGDLASRHARFVLTRASRGALFLGRLLGAWTLVAVPHALVMLAWGAWLGDPVYAARLALASAVFALPLVALLALLNVATRSVAATLLAAASWHAFVAVAGAALPMADSRLGAIEWLHPSAIRPLLLAADPGRFALGLAAGLGLTLALGGAGAWLLARRDV